MFGSNWQYPGNMQIAVPQQQCSNFIRVINRKSVEQYYVAPGSDALFIYEDEPVVAVKRVDMAGIYVIDEYDLVPREHKAEPAYVTREEFDAFVRSVKNEPIAQQQPIPQLHAAASTDATAGRNPAVGAAADDAGAQ